MVSPWTPHIRTHKLSLHTTYETNERRGRKTSLALNSRLNPEQNQDPGKQDTTGHQPCAQTQHCLTVLHLNEGEEISLVLIPSQGDDHSPLQNRTALLWLSKTAAPGMGKQLLCITSLRENVFLMPHLHFTTCSLWPLPLLVSSAITERSVAPMSV